MTPQDNTTPNLVTPAWSRDLAEVQSSPYWGDWSDEAGRKRRDTFIEQALEYATYEDLPGDLKAIYQQAYLQLRSAQQRRRG